ncbi:hypothetical protein Tco_0487557 [Tanacetum coccineum]
MGTKVTSSSGSVLEEPEIQKLQMQAKIFKENSLNKLNALKSTTLLLVMTVLYCNQQAFCTTLGDSVRSLSFSYSQHHEYLETLLNRRRRNTYRPLDIYSRSFSSDQEVKEIFRDYTNMTAQTFKETIIQNMKNSIVADSTVQEIGKHHYSYMQRFQEVSPKESRYEKLKCNDRTIAISDVKELIQDCKGKSVETQFNKPSVVRQPNAQRIPKPSVLGKPTPFSNSPEMRSFQKKQSVNKTNVSDGLFKQVTQLYLPSD